MTSLAAAVVAPVLALLLPIIPGLGSGTHPGVRTSTPSGSMVGSPSPPSAPAPRRPALPLPGTAPAPGVWPLAPQPEVVSDFDPPASRYGAGHRGVDLAGQPGQPVRAAAAGTVTYAGRLAGRGVVVVGHGTTRTTYQPVDPGVQVGDVVAPGQPIGTLEATGSHCAPAVCLHWGLLEGEVYLDPLSLLGAGPVRLLPLLSTPG